MRRLNVALIDIGAGTSDLAISNNGTIVAYGMVPVAGDEITEKVSDHFLLDFKKAEQLKRKVVDEKSATVEDILGFEVDVTFDELVSIIDERVDHLAKLLADKVRELNNKSPQAIMLIGGGSLTPKIDEKLARYLDLPPNRVAVRGSDAIHFIDNKDLIPSGPDFVTPIGIAISATENPFQYMNVFVNDKSTFLFAMDELTIGNCLIQAGIDLHDYYGKIGLAYFATINGKQVTIPGSYGREPSITVNGQVAIVDQLVGENDRITIIKGEDGKSPSMSIKDIVGDLPAFNGYVNGELKIVHPTYLANNKKVNANYTIQDKDVIIAKLPETIGEFLSELKIDYKQTSPFRVYINRLSVEITEAKSKLLLNGKEATVNTPLHEGAQIELSPDEAITLKKVLDKIDENFFNKIQVTFNGKAVTLQQRALHIKRKDLELKLDDVIKQDDELIIEHLPQRNFIFQDVFRFIDFKVPSTGETYRILCNDEDVSFHHEIKAGDRLSLIFD